MNSTEIAEPTGLEIAIIGMAGKFPGARNIQTFWENIKAGVESITFFTEEEIDLKGISPEIIKDPHYVKAGAILEGVEEFDADFFGFYPKEAAILDPQHRIFLECAWEALENAGYDPENYRGWIGVFAGSGLNTYLIYNLIANQEVRETVYGYQLTISNDKDFLPTRVSYKLNLRGPSINVQTACSTSLVATHLACQSLLNYQCDMALAGGVTIRLPQKQGYLYQEGGILSPDGHCRAFDSKAQGTVSGNGVGIVVLKRLQDAINDRDTIVAVIKGSAINNDGSLKVGYTAPSIEGQVEVISMAQAVANIDPETITYIEAHGTGTSLGDPIEITALSQVFSEKTSKKGYCAIGSVKTNVGHLDAAAGVTSLIKTALALKNRVIPPSINFEEPNPNINFSLSPFFVNTHLTPWKANGSPLRAGVSSFGIGGTNAHVILEEATYQIETDPSRNWQIIPLSARSSSALEQAVKNLSSYFKNEPNVDIADVAYTLKVGRKSFNYRKIVLARNNTEAIAALDGTEPNLTLVSEYSGNKTQVVFMFPGQGSQYVQMALGLYDQEPVFKENLDQCAQLLTPIIGRDIRELIFSTNDVEKESLNEQLKQTGLTQPALFIIEYALAKLLISWGIEPVAAIGHSIGEYVAATLAGVFTLEDAIKAVAARGRLMQAMPAGLMVSVGLDEVELKSFINGNLSIAAINGPKLCVVSGPPQNIEEFINHITKEGIEFRRLHTSHAFHSPMMEPILEQYRALLSSIDLHPPSFPFISNLTGTWITREQAMSSEYWTRHLREPVRFFDGVNVLLNDPSNILLEVGPGRALTMLAKLHPSANQGRIILPTVRHPQDQLDDEFFLLQTVSKLWLSGVKVNWEGFYRHERRRRVPLPTYPFERQKYWFEPDGTQMGYGAITPKRSLVKNNNIKEWFYQPTWVRRPLLSKKLNETNEASKNNTLIVLNPSFEILNDSLLSQIINDLKIKEKSCFLVGFGEKFKKDNGNIFTLNPRNPDEFHLLFKGLLDNNSFPNCILFTHAIHFVMKSPIENGNLNPESIPGYLNLLYMLQALGSLNLTNKIKIVILVSELYEVTGEEDIQPIYGLFAGLSRVIQQEYPNLECQIIDVPRKIVGKNYLEKIKESVISELFSPNSDQVVVYRGSYRWSLQYVKVKIDDLDQRQPKIVKNGTYLITGGLGRIGLCFARYFAEKHHANLVLIDRISMPDREKWDEWLSNHSKSDSISKRIENLKEIESYGGRLLIGTGDISDYEQTKALIQSALDHFSVIHGIIHAAGFVGPDSIKAIQEIEIEDCYAHFHAKVNGLVTLQRVIQTFPGLYQALNFILLQSSLSSVLGGLGLGLYSSVNHFMDSYASYRSRHDPYAWIDVHWDGWTFGNELQATNNQLGRSFTGATLVELSMNPDEGVNVLENILKMENPGEVIVSTADLNLRIEQWVKKEVEQDKAPREIAKRGLKHPRPKIQTVFVPPRNQLEEDLVNIWTNILGIEPIGIYDDFFELGGHSLIATQLVTRIRDYFQIEIPLRKIFETPNIYGLANVINAIRGSEPSVITSPIRPVSRDQSLPLSFGQQRLWFLDQLEPGSPLYNNFAAIKIKGLLNIDALKHSFVKIIERHEILRTNFQEKNGLPVQIIHEQGELIFSRIDITDLPSAEREKRVLELALADARTPFKLSEGPLFRVTLLKVDSMEHVLFITTHHIISDGWSVNVIIREIGMLYHSYLEGKEPTLPELPIQYADYAVWQRDWLKGEVLEKELEYWKKQLQGAPPSLDLQTDFIRPNVQTTNGATEWFDLSEDLTQRLRALCREQGVTLFMVLIAGLSTLLYRYTNQEDITIGTPVANRNRVETEGLIGFLLNTLVLRVNINGKSKFSELLSEVKEVSLGAYAHQDIPFEMLVDALQPVRDMSRSPLFQVMFDLQEASTQELSFPELFVSPIKVDTGTAKFDLAISVEEHVDYVSGYFNYNTDLFRKGTIARMKQHFIRLLEAIVFEPNLEVANIPLMNQVEYHQIINEWNQNRFELGEYRNIIDLIEEQAENHPQKVSLQLEENTVTYHDLNTRIKHIARILINNKLRQGSVVALLMERSIDAIVAMLGIMKAGGIYLPLDPSAPKERLQFIIEDANVEFIITQEQIYEAISQAINQLNKNLTVINLEAPILENGNKIENVLFPQLKANDTAYLIYTSGSTGKPKGVLISHRSIADHIRVVKDHFRVSSEDRVLQFSAYSFDQSIEQILVTLISGATLVLRGSQIWDPSLFSKIIEQYQLTIINIQPAYWYQWIQAEINTPSKTDYSQLKLVIIGGDVIYPEHVRLWWQTPMRKVRLLNAYGPTETTITASTYEIQFDDDKKFTLARVPIGKPLPNRKFYILDNSGNPVPIGVQGELFIGGSGVASGYLGRKDLTNEKFVTDRFAVANTNENPIMYRTGDLVRYLPDGNVEFLGRIDFQVKIRGFRIELGEIEAIIGMHPLISDVIVLAKPLPASAPKPGQDGGGTTIGEKRLVAYLQLKDNTQKQEFRLTDLREFLKDRIPAYMLPTAYVILEQFPLLPSGKVDRNKLASFPEIEEVRIDQESQYIAPRTPVEKELAEIWQEVLGVNRVGIYDNFFVLGGHSLLATQIVSRIRSNYQIEIPLRYLFEFPTVASLATAIAQSLVERELELAGEDNVETLISELENLSEEEIQKLLDNEGSE